MVAQGYTKSNKKLFAFLRIFTLILFVGVMIFIYESQVAVFWESTIEHITVTTEKHSETLHMWFVPKMKLVSMVHDDLIYFELTEKDELEHYFTHIREANAIIDNVMAVYIATDDKVIIFSDGNSPPDGFDPTIRVWYIAARENEGNATISEPYVDILTGEIIVTVCKTVVLHNGKNGVIGIDFALTDVVDYVNAIRPYTNGISFLLSDNGYIVTHDNADYLPWKSDGSAFFINFSDIQTGDLSPVDNSNSRVNLERVTTYRRDFFISRIEIEEIGWVFGSEIPISDFNADLRNISFPLIIALISGFFVFALGTIFSLMYENALIKSNEGKIKFLASVSHEIRTPMNAIIGVAQIELYKDDLTDEYRKALEIIYNSSSNLLRIINDILDLTKIESGNLELNPEEYELLNLIDDTVQLNIVQIGSKPIKFMLDVNENLPQKLYGDELSLKQILNNLISNAIKYTEEGFVKLSVYTSYEENSVALHFNVEDTGQGMTLEDRDLLFSEYLRFNTDVNRTIEGTGLGLVITKQLVEMMDGTIWAETEYGKGSTFMVTVKQEAVPCDTIGEELAKKLCSLEYRNNTKFNDLQIMREPMPYGKVLVVDDVETNLYVMKGLLNPYLLNIDTALSGFDVLDLISKNNYYDIIFMDDMMPEMDGKETTIKLRALGYDGAIIAFTANTSTGNEDGFIDNGFNGFISKPIDINNLNDVLLKFIFNKQSPEVIETARLQSGRNIAAFIAEQKADDEILSIFIRDAKKVLPVFEAAAENNESFSDEKMQVFTTSTHAIKSALANIGENDLSETARMLEQSCREMDLSVIQAEIKPFLEAFKLLIIKVENDIKREETEADSFPEILYDKLTHILKACEDYDSMTAKAKLAELGQMQWSGSTNNLLDKINSLILHSNFEVAASVITAFFIDTERNDK
ncbi:MAG: ATP-binding protein [Oscillospiraceae bacterium]|nr:ATP-binding protein [Oscillospiraceae bacterium]